MRIKGIVQYSELNFTLTGFIRLYSLLRQASSFPRKATQCMEEHVLRNLYIITTVFTSHAVESQCWCCCCGCCEVGMHWCVCVRVQKYSKWPSESFCFQSKHQVLPGPETSPKLSLTFQEFHLESPIKGTWCGSAPRITSCFWGNCCFHQ